MIHSGWIEANAEDMPARFGLSVVPLSVFFGLVSFMTRPAVRADEVEKTIRVGDALGVEFHRGVVVKTIDQADEVPGDHPSMVDDDDLSALRLIIRQQAGSRKAVRRRTGDPAHVFGLLVKASRIS